jgi:Domain of unknown function (DUF6285)
MQDRPDAISLLEAIQDFLIKDLLPHLKNEELLSYKALVSWNMLGVISREIKLGEASLDEEIARLKGFLQNKEISTEGKSYLEKLELSKQLNYQLSSVLRKDKVSIDNKAAWNLVKEGIKEKLEISNPRFNTES